MSFRSKALGIAILLSLTSGMSFASSKESSSQLIPPPTEEQFTFVINHVTNTWNGGGCNPPGTCEALFGAEGYSERPDELQLNIKKRVIHFKESVGLKCANVFKDAKEYSQPVSFSGHGSVTLLGGIYSYNITEIFSCSSTL